MNVLNSPEVRKILFSINSIRRRPKNIFSGVYWNSTHWVSTETAEEVKNLTWCNETPSGEKLFGP